MIVNLYYYIFPASGFMFGFQSSFESPTLEHRIPSAIISKTSTEGDSYKNSILTLIENHPDSEMMG